MAGLLIPKQREALLRRTGDSGFGGALSRTDSQPYFNLPMELLLLPFHSFSHCMFLLAAKTGRTSYSSCPIIMPPTQSAFGSVEQPKHQEGDLAPGGPPDHFSG